MSYEIEGSASQPEGDSHQRALDRAAVIAQLGRPPRGNWSVARRCRCGKPQVIQTDPRLDDGTPFPTTWWLTCSRLSARIGSLESGGWMAGFNRRLAEEDGLRKALAMSTEGYIRYRDALGLLGPTAHPGGGPQRVKCLHAHIAHHLVTGDNPAGGGALEELGWVDPEKPCV